VGGQADQRVSGSACKMPGMGSMQPGLVRSMRWPAGTHAGGTAAGHSMWAQHVLPVLLPVLLRHSCTLMVPAPS
jgi:hypothetical protein